MAKLTRTLWKSSYIKSPKENKNDECRLDRNYIFGRRACVPFNARTRSVPVSGVSIRNGIDRGCETSTRETIGRQSGPPAPRRDSRIGMGSAELHALLAPNRIGQRHPFQLL